MPILSAKEAEKYEGGAAKSAASLSLYEVKEKKESEVFYLQHPEHCRDYPMAGQLSVCGKIYTITEGLIKTTDAAVKDYLLTVKWLLIYAAKGANK